MREVPDPNAAEVLGSKIDAPLSGLRALVVGATGMIGAHATRALLHRGVQVRALVRPTSRAENLEGLDVERVGGDLLDGSSVARAVSGCDLLVHAAAPYPRSHFGADRQTAGALTSIRTVLDAARSCVDESVARAVSEGSVDTTLAGLRSLPGLKRVVYVSSLTTIGPARRRETVLFGKPLASEDDAFDPTLDRSPYFRMKAAMEDEALAAARSGLPLVAVNPSLCIDTLDVTPTTAQLLLGVERGQLRFGLPGVVDAVATRDVGVGIARALSVGRIGQRYILGGESLPTTELLARIARAAAVAPPRGQIPLALLELLGRISEVANLIAKRPWPLLPLSSVRMLRHAQPLDTTRARTELALPHTPLDVAIRDTLAWLHTRV